MAIKIHKFATEEIRGVDWGTVLIAVDGGLVDPPEDWNLQSVIHHDASKRGMANWQIDRLNVLIIQGGPTIGIDSIAMCDGDEWIIRTPLRFDGDIKVITEGTLVCARLQHTHTYSSLYIEREYGAFNIALSIPVDGRESTIGTTSFSRGFKNAITWAGMTNDERRIIHSAIDERNRQWRELVSALTEGEEVIRDLRFDDWGDGGMDEFPEEERIVSATAAITEAGWRHKIMYYPSGWNRGGWCLVATPPAGWDGGVLSRMRDAGPVPCWRIQPEEIPICPVHAPGRDDLYEVMGWRD